jgi:hypothetical protein
LSLSGHEFPDHWIGGKGLIPWHHNSPDLTSLDLFFWGFVKDVYCEKVQNMTE